MEASLDAADLISQLKQEISSDRPPMWIFCPVPFPPKPQSSSGRGRQRHRRSMEVRTVAEECRSTLLALCGETSQFFIDPYHGRVDREANDSSSRMHHRLLTCAARLIKARRQYATATGGRIEELFRALGSDWGSMLHDRAAPSAYVPVIGKLIAEPPRGSSVVSLLKELPQHLAQLYSEPHGLFKAEAEVEEILQVQNKCFSKFMGKRSEYISYLHRPDIRDLWDLRPASESRARCAFAAVPKRASSELRKILQVCPMNDAMLSVEDAIQADPGYGLQGTGALTQIVSESDRLVVACLDESNAFTYVEVPQWWRAFQSGPSIAARDVPASWLLSSGLDPCAGDLMLAPQYTRLPMGHTHSVYLLMLINKAAVIDAAKDFPDMKILLLNDEQSLNAGCAVDHRTVAVYIHVDDFGIVSVSVEVAQAFAMAVRGHLERRGFHVKYTPCSEVTRYIGLELTQFPAAWIPAGERLAVLDAVLRLLAKRRYIALASFRTALGQFVSLALLWRPSLSIPHACYRFAQLEVNSAWLWPSVRDEIVKMYSVLPLLVYDIGAPACDIVLSQDAAGPSESDDKCPTGAFCLGCSVPGQIPIDQIQTVLARREVRGRKYIAPDSPPIELRMGAQGVEGRWAPDRSQIAIQDVDWREAALGVPDHQTWIPLERTVLPASWFASPEQWELLLARRWRHHVHINVGELRASTLLFRIFCAATGPRRLRVLDVTDSMVTNGVLSRGRASPLQMNKEARRRAGWEGFTGIRFNSAWCDTHHQPCDSGTRLNDVGLLSIDRPLRYRARLVVEIFAGVGGISAACRMAGLDVSEPWDILQGTHFDLTKVRNQRRLFRLLSSGHVFLVWFGTPCTTFSVARAPLRDADDPSKPREGLSERDLAQFWDGTILAEVTARAIIIAHIAKAFYVVENPFSSGLWRFPPVERALRATSAVFIRTVYCAWGEKWIKPTGLAGTLPGLETLSRDCSGRSNCCQFSGRPHIKLRGRAPDGRWWTKVAEPYPVSFCHACADLINSHEDRGSPESC